MEAEDGPVTLLQSQVPAIVKSLHRQMKEKSIKTRQVYPVTMIECDGEDDE